jgi:hypothetical protein
VPEFMGKIFISFVSLLYEKFLNKGSIKGRLQEVPKQTIEIINKVKKI